MDRKTLAFTVSIADDIIASVQSVLERALQREACKITVKPAATCASYMSAFALDDGADACMGAASNDVEYGLHVTGAPCPTPSSPAALWSNFVKARHGVATGAPGAQGESLVTYHQDQEDEEMLSGAIEELDAMNSVPSTAAIGETLTRFVTLATCVIQRIKQL